MNTNPKIHDLLKESHALPAAKRLSEIGSTKKGEWKGDRIPPTLDLKNILVPIDFSQISRKALDYAVPLAKTFGAKITLLHVFEPLPYPSDMTYVPTGVEFPTKALENDLQALAQSCIEPEFLNKVMVDAGTAFGVIIDVAKNLKIDLIVLTTHGYTGLKHVFMGSTAERVVRHAPCPVLVIRRGEA